MEKIWRSGLFGALLVCIVLVSTNVWAEESARQAGSQPVNLADIDTATIIVQETPAALRRPEQNREADRGTDIVFSEDFQGEDIPAGWVLIDNDGLTVDANVAQFTEAWIVALDFDDATETEFVAMSTSWYNPAGTADDWMITPSIAVTPSNLLSWRGEAQDANFPDGYTVYVSTTDQTIVGCQANPPLFTTPAESGAVWTDHLESLADYSGENVHICFQNNATDQFILMIDDVTVFAQTEYDAAVTAVDQASEYSRFPLLLGPVMALGGTVENLGVIDVTNVVLTAAVLLDGLPIWVEVSDPIPSLAPGVGQAIVLPDFYPQFQGVHSVEYTVTIDETDEDPSNDAALAPFDLLVTLDQVGRDDDVKTGTLGIGDAVSGELGTQFAVPFPVFLDAAVFNVGPFTPPTLEVPSDIIGDQIYVNLRQMVGGVPGGIVATSEVYTFVDYDEHLLTLNFDPNVVLVGGDYMLGVVEEDDNIVLGTSTNIFTPGAGWVYNPGSPLGDWANNEDYGFNVAYMLRAVLTMPVLTVTFDGTGFGTVEILPFGLPCGTGCTLIAYAGMDLTLVPTPDAGSTFSGWTGDADCTDGMVTMTDDLTCNATFDIGNPMLTVSTSGAETGTVTSSPAGIDCGGDCSQEFLAGTLVDLTATPAGSALFMGWSGDADCLDGQVTINSDVHCDARFDLPLFADGFESGDTMAWTP